MRFYDWDRKWPVVNFIKESNFVRRSRVLSITRSQACACLKPRDAIISSIKWQLGRFRHNKNDSAKQWDPEIYDAANKRNAMISIENCTIYPGAHGYDDETFKIQLAKVNG